MDKKHVGMLLGVFSFMMMIGGLVGYLYHTDCCGMKGKCFEMKDKCCGWKKNCSCHDEE